MTAIDQAREYEAATDRIYSRGETKAIMRGLLAEHDKLMSSYKQWQEAAMVRENILIKLERICDDYLSSYDNITLWTTAQKPTIEEPSTCRRFGDRLRSWLRRF